MPIGLRPGRNLIYASTILISAPLELKRVAKATVASYPSSPPQPYWSFRKLGILYFGVLRIRILRFRVLFSSTILGSPFFSETPI